MAIGTRANSKDNSKRKTTGGGPRPDNNAHKQEEAKERQAAWSKLSPQAQLEALDRRLGKGVGATKQRARIAQLLDRPKNPAVAKTDEAFRKFATEKAKERRERERQERPAK